MVTTLTMYYYSIAETLSPFIPSVWWSSGLYYHVTDWGNKLAAAKLKVIKVENDFKMMLKLLLQPQKKVRFVDPCQKVFRVT